MFWLNAVFFFFVSIDSFCETLKQRFYRALAAANKNGCCFFFFLCDHPFVVRRWSKGEVILMLALTMNAFSHKIRTQTSPFTTCGGASRQTYLWIVNYSSCWPPFVMCGLAAVLGCPDAPNRYCWRLVRVRPGRHRRRLRWTRCGEEGRFLWGKGDRFILLLLVAAVGCCLFSRVWQSKMIPWVSCDGFLRVTAFTAVRYWYVFCFFDTAASYFFILLVHPCFVFSTLHYHGILLVQLEGIVTTAYGLNDNQSNCIRGRKNYLLLVMHS